MILREKMKTKAKGKMILSFVMALVLTLSFSTSVFALTPSNTTSTAQRNKIAKNWTYRSRGYAEQNCLSYAIGKGNVWTWPWGASNPTKAQSQAYLKKQGYTKFKNANVAGHLPKTEVYAYVLNSGITHFAKQYSGGGSIAKWGTCEKFSSNSTNPYTNYVYGKLSYRCCK